jgi:hypothetical protein
MLSDVSPKGKLMSHDVKCYELAEAFLSEEPSINSPANCSKLADQIQGVIEDFIESERGSHD